METFKSWKIKTAGETENEEQSLAGTEISLMLGEEESACEEVAIYPCSVYISNQVEEEPLVVSLNMPVTAFQFCPGCGASLSDVEVMADAINMLISYLR